MDTTRLRELLAAATPGPWRRTNDHYREIVAESGWIGDDFRRDEDTDLIVALCNEAEALLYAAEAVERVRAICDLLMTENAKFEAVTPVVAAALTMERRTVARIREALAQDGGDGGTEGRSDG